MLYIRKIATRLEEELTRLEKGTVSEQQRFRNAITAIAKVEANPLNPDFNKDLPQNFKAVDVLQQYRLFFKLIHEGETTIIHFVWMNDEGSLHRSGEKGDCYEVFRNKFAAGEIEQYTPEPEKPEPTFRILGEWGDSFLYVLLDRPPDRATSSLFLSRISEREYRIESVTVTSEDKGLASELLGNLCNCAGQKKIALTFELINWSVNAEKSRYLLRKHGFHLNETIDDVEIWIRMVE